MSFYNELLTATENERNDLLSIPILRSGVEGEISTETYISFLTQAYHHVKHTVPLLMFCGSRLPESKEWLREAIGEYIEEEMGHQEWILNDVRTCGGDTDNVRYGQAALATELMVAYVYDMISRKNPVGFFGMVLVLEGTSIALATQAAGNLQSKLNLPEKAFSYLVSHGSLDIEHMSFYEKLMNRITDADDKKAVIHCARVIYQLYGDIFRSL
ncbi:MAG: iron-containing redox enzyme family protein [Gammaproteobacteria bacterium]|nr:iron-containing redox enzyme family protein [Gammaproteobacteria bacterium]